MTLPVFQRLTSSIQTRLGEDAVLRNEVVDPPRRVNIEHGVEQYGEQGQVVALRSVATIDLAYEPKVGDPLTIGDDDYKLDATVSNNGYSARFALLKV